LSQKLKCILYLAPIIEHNGSTQSVRKMGKQIGRKVDRPSLYMLNVREIQENGKSKTTHVEKR